MSFAEDIKKFQSNTERKASQIARKVGVDLHARIVERTPVDTGRLRANNQLAVGHKPTNSVMDKDKTKTGTPTKAVGEAAIGGYTLGDDIWIANNVEYAAPVEFGAEMGKKMQRPEGFFRASIQDIMQKMPNIVRLST
jgi:hypothetical protein